MKTYLHRFTKYLLLLIGCHLLQPPPAFPQTNDDYIIDVQHFDTQHGLSHREVTRVFQDSKGFIWAGTKYGLNRFDGHRFQVFSKEKNGLASNDAHYIMEDREGWLWVFSRLYFSEAKYLSFVHVETGDVQSVEERFGSTFPFNMSNLKEVIAGKDGSIYMNTGTQLFRYKSSQFENLHHFDKPISIIAPTPSGGIFGFRSMSEEEVQPFVFDGQINLFEEHLPKFSFGIMDQQNTCWFVDRADKKVYKFNTETKTIQQSHLAQLLKTDRVNPTFASHLYYQDSTKFWYKGKDHLYCYHPERGILYDVGAYSPEILNAGIISISFDKSGNAWVCTEFGLFKVRLTKNPFQNYLHQPLEEYDLSTAFSCRGITTQEGRIWVNSNGNRQYIVNMEDGQYQRLLHPTSYTPHHEYPVTPTFRPILKKGDNDFYTADEALVHYQNGVPSKVFYWTDMAKRDMIWSIFQNKEIMWLGLLRRGLGTVKGDSLVLFDQYNGFEELPKNTVYHFLKWDDQHILLASSVGIYVLHMQKGVIKRFWTGGDENTQLPFDVTYHLEWGSEEKNVVWAATGGGGLLRLTLDKEKLSIAHTEQFTIMDGLSNNVIYAAYQDEVGNIWLPSDYGVIQFDKATQSASAYTVLDGLPFNEFNRISHYKAPDGRLFFGTMNGVTSFYPKDLLGIQEELNVPLRIIEYKQFDGRKNQLIDRTSELVTSKHITLQPNDKFLTLTFALLEYKDASQIKYSYQLKGQSDEWIYLNNNELRLSGLPFGKFTLNIRAQGVSGQFSSSTLAIPITAMRPFYTTSWFVFLAALLLIGSVLKWNKNRLESLKTQQVELEKQVAERTATITAQAEELRSLDQLKSRFFANISHELRTPLTLILAPIQNILKRNQLANQDHTQLLLAEKNTQQLGKLVNQILDLTKLESGELKLRADEVNWYTFLRNITANFESLASIKDVHFQFSYDGGEYLRVEMDRDKMKIILRNLLSNAFKFTPQGGTVSLIAKNTAQHLQVTVADNGRGIPPNDLPHIFDRFFQTNEKNAPAEGGTGIGLALCQEFTRLMGGQISVESVWAKGATFKVQVPRKEIIRQLTTEEALLIEQNGQTAPPAENEPTKKTTQPQNGHPDHRPTILLAEDNHHLRQFIKSILSEKYNVITAENGKAALQWLTTENQQLSTNNCQLLISDIMMPIMDGYQLLEAVKSHPVHQHLPVIMLTARAGLNDRLKALRIGVDDYLTKPFHQEELIARIDNLLKNAANRQAAWTETAPETPMTAKASPKTTTSRPNLPDEETQAWLVELEKAVAAQINNPRYTTELLAKELHMSKRQLLRRMKATTGLAPSQYIKTCRLTKARGLLERNAHTTVKEVAFSVGYKDVPHFSKQFKEAYGRVPSELLV